MGKTKSIHWPQFQEKELVRYMPNPIKRSTLPVSRVGASSTTPSVTISENGQLRFNVVTAKALEGLPLMVIGDFDEKSRVITFKGVAEPPKGWSMEDCFTLNVGKKGGGAYLSAAGLWKQVGYDFKASGNQNASDLVVNAEKKTVAFSVPKGALTPKPKQARAPRTAKPAASAAAASGGDDIVI